jgi:hypothetical protein
MTDENKSAAEIEEMREKLNDLPSSLEIIPLESGDLI